MTSLGLVDHLGADRWGSYARCRVICLAVALHDYQLKIRMCDTFKYGEPFRNITHNDVGLDLAVPVVVASDHHAPTLMACSLSLNL